MRQEWRISYGLDDFRLLRWTEASAEERAQGASIDDVQVQLGYGHADPLGGFDAARSKLVEILEQVQVGRFADPSRIATHELRAMLVREVRRGKLLALPLPRTLEAAKKDGGGGGIAPTPPPGPTPKPKTEKYGVTALTLPPRFAPGVEKVGSYDIDDAAAIAPSAQFELFRTVDGKLDEASPIWTRSLLPAERSHGHHDMKWDGKIEGHSGGDDFPDHYVTVEYSPYKLRITLPGGNPQKQEATFAVEVAEIELELGPKDVLSQKAEDKRHLDVYDSLKGKLAPDKAGAAKELKLVSNVFSTGNASMFDDTCYTEYETLWKDGPNVPVFAKVWIKNTAGKKVEAPLALGRVKFLWDWEDQAEDLARYEFAESKTFVTDALDFDKQKTGPKGDNCHDERGGKRGPAAKAVFPAQAGYAAQAALKKGDFPFVVEACATRKWAAFSTAWTSGALASKTGVLFQPSRMAGDAYKLTVYLAKDKRGKALDVADAAPLKEPIKKQSDKLEVWRQVDLVNYVKKKSTFPDFAVATFQGYYEKAFIRMNYTAGAAVIMKDGEYNTHVTAAVATLDWDGQLAIDSTVNQYTIGDYAVHFRDFPDWKTRVKTAKGWTDAQFATWAGTVVGTPAQYYSYCDSWATTVTTKACDAYVAAGDGVNVLQFAGWYNWSNKPGGQALNGFAAQFPSCGKTKCAFVQCATAASYTGNSNRMEQTITHEIGHHLFLPHAPDGVTATDAANKPDPTAHDEAWHNCTLSYNYNKERKFCGLCLLRLRGWKKSVLKKKSADNKRT